MKFWKHREKRLKGTKTRHVSKGYKLKSTALLATFGNPAGSQLNSFDRRLCFQEREEKEEI